MTRMDVDAGHAQPGGGRRAAHAVLAGFAFAAIALLALFEWVPIDLHVQRALFDPVPGDFRWHRDPRLEYWLHIQARRALYLFPAIAGLGWMIESWASRRATPLPRRRLAASRARRWRFVLVALLLAPTAVSLAKQLTDRPCPWDLAEFGGGVRRYGLFEPAPAGSKALACFPAGHASGGFALFAFALAAAGAGEGAGGVGSAPAHRRRKAFLAWFTASAVLGTLLGVVRVLQGAHFVSHVLWSAWLVWLVQWSLARWMLRAPECRLRSAIGAAGPSAGAAGG
ncbi:MAG TPA: phosphatase PAP2 family protein [Zeimonas sp.]